MKTSSPKFTSSCITPVCSRENYAVRSRQIPAKIVDRFLLNKAGRANIACGIAKKVKWSGLQVVISPYYRLKTIVIEKDSLLAMGTLVLAIAASFANSLPGAFHFDDFSLLLENPRVLRFDYSAFLDHYGGRPLTLWTFFLNHQWSGPQALGFHAVNLTLHVGVTFLVFLLARKTLKRTGWAWFAALVFAIHPLQNQAVNYIWSRSVLLMALFGLLAIYTVRKAPLLSLFSFQLAVWSRTEALLFAPLLFFMMDRNRFWLTALSLLNAGAFLLSVLWYSPQEIAWNHTDPLAYWSTQPVLFWKYFSLFFLPLELNIDHDFFKPSSSIVMVSLLGCVAFFLIIWKSARQQPAMRSGIFWYGWFFAAAWLVPNSDFLNETRAYLPLAGLAVVLAALMQRYLQHSWWIGIAATLFLLAAVPLNRERNRLWNDDVALWEDAANKSPAKPRVHYNLGVAYAREGRLAPAREEFQQALRLNPGDDLSYAAVGYCAEKLGDLRGALHFYGKALELKPANRYAQRRVRNLNRLETVAKGQGSL